MVLLLTDVFLLLTQVILWIIVGVVIWFFLQRILSKEFLGILVLILFLIVILLAFVRGGINEPGSVLEIIWRVISFPLSPFGLGVILLLILLTGRFKPTKFTLNVIRVVLVLLLLGSVPLISYFLAQELEAEAVELIAPAPAPEGGGRQVIVLLGKNTTRLQLRPRRDGPPTTTDRVERAVTPEQFEVVSQLPVQMTEHGDRILYAAQLYQQETQRGTNPLIVVSAGSRANRMRKDNESREDITEARDIQTMLTQTFGVPDTSILLDHNNGSIHSSAEEVKKLLSDRQVNYGDQIILVGSALNMNRAALTFQHVFDESRIIVRPTDFFTLPMHDRLRRVVQGRDLIEREIQVTDVLPTVDAFYISSLAIQEYLNSFYYFIRGWIRPFQPPNLNRPNVT